MDWGGGDSSVAWRGEEKGVGKEVLDEVPRGRNVLFYVFPGWETFRLEGW